MHRHVSRIALGAAAAVAITVPLTGTASAMSYDRHEVARTAVNVTATPGHLAVARRDVMQLGGQVVRWLPGSNTFVAQIPVTSLVSLRHAPGISAVTVQGALLQQ